MSTNCSLAGERLLGDGSIDVLRRPLLKMALDAASYPCLGTMQCCPACVHRMKLVCTSWHAALSNMDVPSCRSPSGEDLGPALCAMHWNPIFENISEQLVLLQEEQVRANRALPSGLDALRRQREAPRRQVLVAVEIALTLGGFPQQSSSSTWDKMRPTLGHPDLVPRLRKLDLKKERKRASDADWARLGKLFAEARESRQQLLSTSAGGPRGPVVLDASMRPTSAEADKISSLGLWRWVCVQALVLELWERLERAKNALMIRGVI